MPAQPAWFHRLGTGNLDRTRHQMAAHDVGEWLVGDLPETITRGPGELRIVFDGALDLASHAAG